ncbi:hypothetical protein ABZ464_50525 [Streptomyces sp. NPDC005820]|uniref:hypothetical protein n=1 Tax=Streptomyces sp. NPDC005820 TaxID=3157069 RepID=UPI0033C2133B
MSLKLSHVPVHAVEPARSMRSALMTRLASLSAGLRSRVTVHPCTLDEAGLREVADVAVCHNTIACLHPASRRALWPAAAEALAPAGVLLVQPGAVGGRGPYPGPLLLLGTDPAVPAVRLGRG